MVIINLLPWRQYAFLQQKRVTKNIIVTTLFLCVFISISIHKILSQQESKLNFQLDELKQAVGRYDLQGLIHEKTQKLKATNTLLELNNYRVATQKLFLALSKPHQYVVCFTRIARTKNTVSFTGSTRSAAELTDFLHQWSAAYLFSEIKIEQLARDQNHLMRFRFQALENNRLPEGVAT